MLLLLQVSTYNNILTSGLQSRWLAAVLSGRVALPPTGEMAADIRAQQRWRRDVMPGQRSRGSVLMLYMMDYHDQLLKVSVAVYRVCGTPLACLQ